jgi:hypothetical protein
VIWIGLQRKATNYQEKCHIPMFGFPAPLGPREPVAGQGGWGVAGPVTAGGYRAVSRRLPCPLSMTIASTREGIPCGGQTGNIPDALEVK